MKLKVCGMKYPNNIQEVASLEIDYMGFIFYPKSKRYVGEDIELSVIKAIPSRIKPVAVFVNESKERIIELAKKYNFNILQLHGNESPDFVSDMSSLGFIIIKAFAIDTKFNFELTRKYETYTDYFLFDTKSDSYGGTGESFDWNLLSKYHQETPFFLSGGLSIDNISSIKNFNELNIHALDLNSKFESEPGLKKIDLIKKAIQDINNLDTKS
ncbi:MAG: phosphoribosylanthranilate isomerase [Cytophagales bacterium]|nr:MAG: phosphoribosylanthranilate isomerase [Cytophagales bacterium]